MAVGVLLGTWWAVQKFSRSPIPGAGDEDTPTAIEQRPAFGQYFTLFFLGRTGDGSHIRKHAPLIRATKFLPGERVGIRAQTATGVTVPIRIELRFLSRGTREERPELRNTRQRFTIRPGIFSICCVRIPKRAGPYDLGILIDDRYVGYLPITIKPAPKHGSGGLFGPSQQ